MKKWAVDTQTFKERMFRLTHATRSEEAIHLEEILCNAYNEVFEERAALLLERERMIKALTQAQPIVLVYSTVYQHQLGASEIHPIHQETIDLIAELLAPPATEAGA